MEIFKDIVGYEGLYQVSNMGNVKSLPREVFGRGYYMTKEKTLKPGVDTGGYFNVRLCKNGKLSTYTIHQLVAMTFLGHLRCGYDFVIDHINRDKLDNRVENLRVVTNRENCSNRKRTYTSKYVGVSWDKSRKKWASRMQIDNIYKNLGYFEKEYDAHVAYQNKLLSLSN
jgi:hypothetical protein